MSYRLSPRAQSDLEGIWDFTRETWGVDQAERYVRLIRDVVVSLAQNPRRGRPCDDIRDGYFKAPAGSHVIFYLLSGNDIVIVRILHARMDFNRHL